MIWIGYVKNRPLQSFANLPQEGIDGSRPIPTKLKKASVKMADGTNMVKLTIIGPIAFTIK